MSALKFGLEYFAKATEPEEVRKYARKHLKNVEFDTVVGTGYSGALVLGVLARSFKCNMLVVRKPSDIDHSHSSDALEGYLGDRWLFVDDFISSGRTFVRVHQTIARVLRRREVKTGKRWKSECVGAFSYEKWGQPAPYAQIETLRREYVRIDEYFADLHQIPRPMEGAS